MDSWRSRDGPRDEDVNGPNARAGHGGGKEEEEACGVLVE